MKYRVTIPFKAVYRKSDGSSEFIQMEPGSVFSIRKHVQSGMVIIMHERRALFVFMSDVDSRCETVLRDDNL
ncbi:MAG TPA: hypothetical protein VFW44_06910 [Bryobacteraceae bacterium]|nr:hypothetical protein [Bryobacteraceae bacterium]